MTKLKRDARERLLRLMWELRTTDDEIGAELRHQVPEAWHLLDRDDTVSEPKEKVTLRLDRSVVKFFRAMGTGYGARVNRVLATYAAMHLAGAIQAEQALEAEMERVAQRSEAIAQARLDRTDDPESCRAEA